MPYTVFLSHCTSPEDMKYVNWFDSTLRNQCIGCYVAEWYREPNNLITDKIKNAINDSQCALVLWTKKGRGSQFVNQEVGYAEDKKLIIPLVEKGVPLGGFLYGRDCIEFERNNPTGALNSTVEYINQLKLAKEQQDMATGMVTLLISLFTLGGLLAAASR